MTVDRHWMALHLQQELAAPTELDALGKLTDAAMKAITTSKTAESR